MALCFIRDHLSASASFFPAAYMAEVCYGMNPSCSGKVWLLSLFETHFGMHSTQGTAEPYGRAEETLSTVLGCSQVAAISLL